MPDPIADAIDRGEIVAVLADMNAGRLTVAAVSAGIAEWERRHWFARLVAAMLA